MRAPLFLRPKSKPAGREKPIRVAPIRVVNEIPESKVLVSAIDGRESSIPLQRMPRLISTKGSNGKRQTQSRKDVFLPSMGHTPSTAGTFRKKFRKNSGKTPEMLSERFLEFPSRVRLGSLKLYTSRHVRLPEHFQNSLPPQYGWGRLFFQKWFRRGPLRAGHGIPSSTGGGGEKCHKSK